jgi:hypothetical protein
MPRSSGQGSGARKTTRCEDFGRSPPVPAERFSHAPITRRALRSKVDSSNTTLPVMSNIPVAFLVLGAFFTLYFVAALWRSRPR